MRCVNCSADGLETATTVCPRCSAYLPALLRDVLPPGTVLRNGAYHIDYALGRGGFGITYRAMHTALEHAVAIKEFYPQEVAHRNDSSFTVTVSATHQAAYERNRQRFLREGRILTRLDHPGIVKVRDLFEERGTAYMVMDLINGHSLRHVLDGLPNRRLPPDRLNSVMDQLVSALAAVHAEGVYHLDIKPNNILLTEAGRVVLVDFGAAKQDLGGGLTTQSFTVEYAAPEVLAGGEVGPESDIFELGMLLHELATGERPPGALARLMHDNWTPTALPEPWSGRVREATRLPRAARPASVTEWWAALPGAAAPASGKKKENPATPYLNGLPLIFAASVLTPGLDSGSRVTLFIVLCVLWSAGVTIWNLGRQSARNTK